MDVFCRTTTGIKELILDLAAQTISSGLGTARGRNEQRRGHWDPG